MIYTFGDLFCLEADVKLKLGVPKEEILRDLVEQHNFLQDMKYSIFPFFGKKLAEKHYLDAEKIIKQL